MWKQKIITFKKKEKYQATQYISTFQILVKKQEPCIKIKHFTLFFQVLDILPYFCFLLFLKYWFLIMF